MQQGQTPGWGLWGGGVPSRAGPPGFSPFAFEPSRALGSLEVELPASRVGEGSVRYSLQGGHGQGSSSPYPPLPELFPQTFHFHF